MQRRLYNTFCFLAIHSQTEGLENYASELDKLQNVLNSELSLSQANVLRSIQVLIILNHI